LHQQLEIDPQLQQVKAEVADSGEGRWAVEEALRFSVPFGAITAALYSRYSTRQTRTFVGRVLSAMRLGFGGHKE
jgi:6-phosphogluconate dehydrogenase